MKRLHAYWLNEFDWAEQQRRLNGYNHFRYSHGENLIHFIRARGVGPNPMPLIITHGWPGSFAEMLRIIPLLSDQGANGGDPADAFDVVVPSIPGYG
jgi:pimeloyl-ACP methyl ester carboxylesterase